MSLVPVTVTTRAIHSSACTWRENRFCLAREAPRTRTACGAQACGMPLLAGVSAGSHFGSRRNVSNAEAGFFGFLASLQCDAASNQQSLPRAVTVVHQCSLALLLSLSLSPRTLIRITSSGDRCLLSAQIARQLFVTLPIARHSAIGSILRPPPAHVFLSFSLLTGLGAALGH